MSDFISAKVTDKKPYILLYMNAKFYSSIFKIDRVTDF
jgi:hypothetical protein